MVFDAFRLSPYCFLQLESTAAGNGAVREYQAQGVLKLRDGLKQDTASEAYTSDATLHIRPDEPFVEDVGGHLQLVGHGIRAEGDDYRIVGITVGKDFDTGSVEFYRATLKKEALWQSSLPLE